MPENPYMNQGFGGVQNSTKPQWALDQEASDAAMRQRVADMQNKAKYLGWNSVNTGPDGNVGNLGMNLDQVVGEAKSQGWGGANGTTAPKVDIVEGPDNRAPWLDKPTTTQGNPYLQGSNLGMGGSSPTIGGSGAMQKGWNDWWQNNPAGSSMDFLGGKVSRNADGTATFNGGGQTYTYGQNTPFEEVAGNIPGLADKWRTEFGYQQPNSQGPTGNGVNPWLRNQATALQAMSNKNLQQNVLPGIGQGAMAQGMYGSSRQGVAEGRAMADAQTGLNSALANMYSQSYGQDQQYDLGLKNNALGNKQADNGYDLGLRSNDLGFGQLDFNINQGNFNNQLAGANFGLGIYDRMNGYNSQGLQYGNQIQQTPWNNFNQGNANTMAAAGTGQPNQVAAQGNPFMAGVGAGTATYGAINNWLKTTTGR